MAVAGATRLACSGRDAFTLQSPMALPQSLRIWPSCELGSRLLRIWPRRENQAMMTLRIWPTDKTAISTNLPPATILN